jgi:hypothetical protein
MSDFDDIERRLNQKYRKEFSRTSEPDKESEPADVQQEQNVPDKPDSVLENTKDGSKTEHTENEPENVSEHEDTKPKRRLPDVPDEPDADTVSASVEMSPAGTHMATEYKSEDASDMELPKRKPTVKQKSTAKQKPAVKQKSRRQKSEVVYLRNVPKSVAGEARRIFPTANNNTDAVAAYIAYKSGVRDGLTDTQLELLDTTEVSDPIVEQNQRIAHIENTMVNMSVMMRELETAMSYIIFDRLGFRRENPDAPRQANLNEPGMTEMIERVREMSRQMYQQEKRRKGRPFR